MESNPTTSRAIAKDDAELQNALWVGGRIVLPEGTPPDEHVEVVADGKRFESRELYHAPIGPDGSFRVAFAEGTGTGLLTLRARYLYLENGRAVEPAHPPKELVLLAKLGGCMRGRLVVGKCAPPLRTSLAGCKVWATGDLMRAYYLHEPPFFQGSRTTEDLRFEFTGLPPGLIYSIGVDDSTVANIRRADIEVKAGAVVDVDLDVRIGARVSGRVSVEGVHPVSDVRVSACTAAAPGSSEYIVTTTSDFDGCFHLTGIRPGRVTVRADRSSQSATELLVGDLSEGEEKAGVELVLPPD
jgi:hypothetical protein